MLAERFDFTKFAADLYGCDLSPEMLQIAKEHGKYLDLKTSNIEERIPFDDNTFDVVISNGKHLFNAFLD